MDNFKDSLSTHSKNGIARCFGRDVLDKPEVIAATGPARLIMTSQVGTVTLREIGLLLYYFGYIDNPVKWLEN